MGNEIVDGGVCGGVDGNDVCGECVGGRLDG